MVWSMERLGRSVLHVAEAIAEPDSAGVALVSEKQGIDALRTGDDADGDGVRRT